MKKLLFVLLLAVVPFITSAQATPSMVISSDFVNFNYTVGDPLPNLVQITLFNQSNAETISFNISVPNQPAWLNGGYNTDTLPISPSGVMGVGVSVDPTKVGPGSYSYDIGLIGNFVGSPKKIHVTLNVSPTTVPTITSVQSPAENPNILHPGEKATVYGTNITSSWTPLFNGSYGSNFNRVYQGGSGAEFTVPLSLSSGYYNLTLAPDGKGSQTNSISVQVIKNVVTSAPVDLKVASSVTGSSGSLISASIAGNPSNDSVSYWKLLISCGLDVVVSNYSGNNVCGTEYRYDRYNVGNPGIDYVMITTFGLKNNSGSQQNVVLSLVAYNANGNNIGGDKEGILLGANTSTLSTNNTTIPTTIPTTKMTEVQKQEMIKQLQTLLIQLIQQLMELIKAQQ